MASATDALGFVATCLSLMFAWFIVARHRSHRPVETSTKPHYRCGQSSSQKPVNGHIAFQHERIATEQATRRAAQFYNLMRMRRSVSFISSEPVKREVVVSCIAAAATAPSGAHCQPWHFCLVESAAAKQQLRDAVESEEKINYAKRMGKQWVGEVEQLLTKLPTNWSKPYLSDAPFVIVLMKKSFLTDKEGNRRTDVEVRYPSESVGIAAGVLIAALHNANLVTLTSTPLGADAKIRAVLGRPEGEKVFLLLPVGYPADNATVPHRSPGAERLPLADVMTAH